MPAGGDNDPHQPFFAAAEKGDAGALGEALRQGVDVDARGDGGTTALMIAAGNGDAECLELLLEHGAGAGCVDESGNSPLTYAARKDSNSLVIRILISHHGDVDHRNSVGNTPLIESALMGHLSNVAELSAHSASLDAGNDAGETALTSAAAWGHLEVVEHLLACGADVNLADGRGGTALMWATLAQQRQREVVDLLLESGADVHRADDEGYTALMHAVGRRDEWILRRILAGGADVRHSSHDGSTAMGIARKLGYADMVRVLRETGTREGGAPVSSPRPAPCRGE